MEDCQFCKIASHSVKTEILYENDSTISFLDHRPLSKGHAVVIPKTHFVNIYDIDCSTLNEVTRVAKLLAIKLNENMSRWASIFCKIMASTQVRLSSIFIYR
ncbi:MAG: HIT domain-containing protein [Candidatus Thermoplasmatota archaeon]|nr:HIT domain-containing protein [Candidatus Thermoplasmatota archaeon]